MNGHLPPVYSLLSPFSSSHSSLLAPRPKAAGLGPRGQGDNCYAEFSYSLNRRGVSKMVAVVMEPNCLDTAQWQGVVGLRLGMKLCVVLTQLRSILHLNHL